MSNLNCPHSIYLEMCPLYIKPVGELNSLFVCDCGFDYWYWWNNLFIICSFVDHVWFVMDTVSRILIISKLVIVLACNWQHRSLPYNSCIWYHDQKHHRSHPIEYAWKSSLQREKCYYYQEETRAFMLLNREPN